MNQTDEQLVRAYLDGEETAFTVLVDRYMKHLFHFIRQLVTDSAVAEDIVQETFLKVWKNLHRFDGEKSFKTWIFAIAKNTAYDALKKKKALPFSVFMDEEGKSVLEQVPDKGLGIEEVLDQEATAQELTRKLATLTPLYRTLLVLHYQEYFTLHEIALIFGEPYNTIKSRHQRALRALKEAFLSRAS
ncbi:MAG: sigma-70 family RNA polymerase sigma factor [Candidatus Moranbacteria bacterium]|nr:sigma-70 family RNA polymerase sigma factor [Candidatus Moranbacteria bacterium]